MGMIIFLGGLAVIVIWFVRNIPNFLALACFMFFLLIAGTWLSSATCSRPMGDVGEVLSGKPPGRYSELRFAKDAFLRKYEETDWNQLYEKYDSDFVKFAFMDMVDQHHPPEDEIFELRGKIDDEYPKALAFAESKVGHKLTLHSEMFGKLKVTSFLKSYRRHYWNIEYLEKLRANGVYDNCRNVEEVAKTEFTSLVRTFSDRTSTFEFSEREYRRCLRMAEQQTGQELSLHRVW